MLWTDKAPNGGDPVLDELSPFMIHSLDPINCHLGVSEAEGVRERELDTYSNLYTVDLLRQQQR